MSIRLTVRQNAVAGAPLDQKIFLTGIAGTGKTTAAVRRLRHLLESGVPGHEILVLVPQKGLAAPYLQELRSPRRPAGGEVTVTTLGGLSRQMVELFWPLIVQRAAPQHAERQPVFLSLDLVQYLMSKHIGPLIDRSDFFNSVRISRGRLYSQIVDNLNKAAVVGFPPAQISTRLKAATRPDPEAQHIYDDAQVCADAFRQLCDDHALIDFSLQVTYLVNTLWGLDLPRQHLTRRYRHLIVDNIEEDAPATHYLLKGWLREAHSALVVYDEEAGFRSFLGADPVEALELKDVCDRVERLDDTRVMSGPMLALHRELRFALSPEAEETGGRRRKGESHEAIVITDPEYNRYHTSMLDWIAESAASLVHDQGVPQREIVILAPLLSDSLRFALTARLNERGLDTYTLRPSRPLQDEPAARAVITLARLAHPDWSFAPARRVKPYDVTQMLLAVIHELDLPRAALFTECLFQQERLQPFRDFQHDAQRARMTEVFGQRYQRLVDWLQAYQSDAPAPIDVFFSRLFGEVLSQPGYGFHHGFDQARIVAHLIDAARQFRQTVSRIDPEADTGRDFLAMLDEGVGVEPYAPNARRPDAILVAPAYTFLLSNQCVDYQLWVNIDSPAWGRRLYQPLTQPYVLSKQWAEGAVWNEEWEQATSSDMMIKVIGGLLRRCRRRVYFGYSQFNERGYEHVSDLRYAVDYVLQGGIEEAADG